VNPLVLRRGKRKRLFLQQLGNSSRDFIGLFRALFFHREPSLLGFIVGVDEFLDFFDGDIALDVPFGGIDEVWGGLDRFILTSAHLAA